MKAINTADATPAHKVATSLEFGVDMTPAPRDLPPCMTNRW
jgi:hypothetical protein